MLCCVFRAAACGIGSHDFSPLSSRIERYNLSSSEYLLLSVCNQLPSPPGCQGGSVCVVNNVTDTATICGVSTPSDFWFPVLHVVQSLYMRGPSNQSAQVGDLSRPMYASVIFRCERNTTGGIGDAARFESEEKGCGVKILYNSKPIPSATL